MMGDVRPAENINRLMCSTPPHSCHTKYALQGWDTGVIVLKNANCNVITHHFKLERNVLASQASVQGCSHACPRILSSRTEGELVVGVERVSLLP